MIPARGYWQGRAASFGPGWLEHYWDSAEAPHRQALADAVGACGSFRSLLELGCHCGPNLRLWRHRWPDALLLGVDVSPEAVAFGQAMFAADPLTHLVVDDFRESSGMPAPVDVVVSCYAVSYVPPGEFLAVLEKVWKWAGQAVVMAEPMCIAGEAEGPCAEDIEEWRYDYAAAFRALGASTVEVRMIPPADRLNGIVIARRGE